MSKQNVRKCKWKAGVSGRSPEGKIKRIEFPCRYPDEELTSELCMQCLLGDIFSLFYTQTMGMQKSMNMQEEMMAFLKNFTTDDFGDMR